MKGAIYMASVEILKKATLFKSLSDDQLEAIGQLGQEKSFGSGEEIFKQDQKADTLYVLLDGAVTLMFTVGTEAQEETDLMVETLEEPGSVFGTAALVNPFICNVTARCTKRSRALAIDSVGFREIIRREPLIGFEVMTKLAQIYFNRLNSTRAAVTSLFKTFKFRTRRPKGFDTPGESR
jgi:CRP/FNR family cyclic AMP-dependent transcriptional regulator